MREESDNSWNYDYIRLAWDSGFYFTSKNTNILVNLNSLSLVDIEKTVNERDIASVERHITTIVNYNLDDEQTRILDGTFVKVFKLGQLAIQYLLFCKKYLDHTVTLLKKEIHQLNEENRNLLEETDNQKQDILELRRKLKGLKQVVDIQPDTPARTYQCNRCGKIFSSEEFLMSHVRRRHENPPLIQTEADKLQMEIKELKERLNSTEKYVQYDQPIVKESGNEFKENVSGVFEIQSEVDKLNIQLENQCKIIEEHRKYQAKYEKWMEIVFEKFENKQIELIEKKLRQNETKNIWTQTAEKRSIETQYEAIPTSSTQTINQTEDLQQVRAELAKIQSDIEQEARNRFEKMEGFLEEKVSDKFDKFSKQMEMFWNKVEEAQSKLKCSPERLPIVLYEKSRSINKPQQQQPPTIQFSENQSSQETSSDALPVPATIKSLNARKSTTLDYSPSQSPSLTTIRSFALQPPKPQPRKSISQTSNKGVNIQQQIHQHPVRDNEQIYVKDKESGKLIQQIDYSSEETVISKQEIIPTTKPSYTSTLGQRSITSLKRAAFDEDVKVGLKEELQDLLHGRLINLGISPDWNGLSDETFERALSIMRHQSSLACKKIPKYEKFRKELSKAVDKKAKATSLESLQKQRKFAKQTRIKIETPVSFKSQMYKEEMAETTLLLSNMINSKVNKPPAMTIKQQEDQDNNVHDVEIEMEHVQRGIFHNGGEGETIDKAQATVKPIVLTPKHEIFNDSGEGPKESESSKTNVKKKVLFDLESLSKNSSDTDKIEAIAKKQETKKFDKPVYFDELKNVISMKVINDLDSTMDSITFDEKETNDSAVKEKDYDGSDWDISEILN